MARVRARAPGSAKPPTEGGPRTLSAGEGGATTMFNGFTNFGDIKGESTDARGVGRLVRCSNFRLRSRRSGHRSRTDRQTPVVGEKLPRSAPALAAPSVRR